MIEKKGLVVPGAVFPMFFRIHPTALEQFRSSEEGSYSDSRAESGAANEGDTPDPDVEALHVYCILGRHKGKIEVRNADEALVVYLAACSGTWQTRWEREHSPKRGANHEGDGRGYYDVAVKVCDTFRQFVPQSWLRMWPKPAGV